MPCHAWAIAIFALLRPFRYANDATPKSAIPQGDSTRSTTPEGKDSQSIKIVQPTPPIPLDAPRVLLHPKYKTLPDSILIPDRRKDFLHTNGFQQNQWHSSAFGLHIKHVPNGGQMKVPLSALEEDPSSQSKHTDPKTWLPSACLRQPTIRGKHDVHFTCVRFKKRIPGGAVQRNRAARRIFQAFRTCIQRHGLGEALWSRPDFVAVLFPTGLSLTLPMDELVEQASRALRALDRGFHRGSGRGSDSASAKHLRHRQPHADRAHRQEKRSNATDKT